MDYQITTAPMYEPISLERAKRHLRVDTADEEDLIRAYLTAARQWCEEYVARAFLWQVITAKMDNLSDDQIELPRPPLIAVASITYVDGDGTTQTLATSEYDVDTSSEPGKIVLAYDGSWPTVRGHHHDVTITYYAGHAKSWTRSGGDLLVDGGLFRANDPVQVYNIGGALPAELAAGTQYCVRTVDGHTIDLATGEGGAEIVLTGDGTGTHYIDCLPKNYVSAILMRLTDLWVNRGEEDLPVSRGIRELLGIGRMTPV